MLRAILLATSLVVVSAAPAYACTCVITAPFGAAKIQRPWTDRPAIFTALVLDVDSPTDTTLKQSVRLLTEKSWRGAMPDIVTLAVDIDASCAWYFPGLRYVVLADTAPGDRTRLVTAACDDAFGVAGPAAARIRAELGEPNWTAPPTGSRALDSLVFPLGTPLSRISEQGRVAFEVPYSGGVRRFEIGDEDVSPYPTGGPILYLLPGLYEFRITWTDGRRYHSYLSVRCEHQLSDGGCFVSRSFFPPP